MADTKKITIEIISSGSDSQETPTDVVDDELNPKETNKKKKTGTEIWMSMAAQRALNIALQTLDSSTNRYFYMKEDYLGEAMYHNVKNNVNKVIGAVSTIATGAKIGSAPGAIIAAVGVAANEGISIFNKYASLENQMNTLNYGMEFSRTRAGLVDNGRGTEN